MARASAALVGAVFGFALMWSGLAEPDVIRRGLLFEEAYLFLTFFAAVGTAGAGVHLLRAARARAVLTGEQIRWQRLRPERRHVVGSILFGTGWAISASCPGPIAAQLGGGVLWSLATLVGVGAGIKLYLVRHQAAGVVPERAAS